MLIAKKIQIQMVLKSILCKNGKPHIKLTENKSTLIILNLSLTFSESQVPPLSEQ